MEVRDIMSRDVKLISSSTMLDEAAAWMQKYDIGALPVVQDEETIGVITDRDVVIRAIAAGMDPRTTPVTEVMTTELACCHEHDSIEDAARIMEERQVHRLLVTDGTDKIVGILSISDLTLKIHNEHLVYEVLEQICEPAHSIR